LDRDRTELGPIPVKPLIERSRVRIVLDAIVPTMKTILYFVLFLFSSLSFKRYVAVLAYHSVDSNGSFFTVAPEMFNKQMDYMMKHCAIVSLQDVVDFAAGKRSLPRRSVALTFDDGYYDNYANVYAYAKKFTLPVAIFVTAGVVGGQMLLGNMSLKMLNWEQLQEMSRSGVTIGAHTRTHPNLQRVEEDRAREEIHGSKAEIEKVLGRPVQFFAYPYGAYTENLFAILESLDFAAAFGGDGLIRQGDNRYILKRVAMDKSVNFTIFKAKLTIATEWYRQVEKVGSRLVRLLPFSSDVTAAYEER
jgi:peptidoglycan/xylan/chitin deacetylase (PgdA/CDA1 family)